MSIRERTVALALLGSVVGLLVAGCASADPRAELSAEERQAVSSELAERLERDQFYRSFDYPSADDTTQRRMMREWSSTDSANLVYVRDLIERIGWPDSERFGAAASRAAFVLVQHADADPAFQERMLPILSEAVARGEASARDLAYLTDRIRVAQARPQVYGTQYDVVKNARGSVVAGPDGRIQYVVPVVEDLERLDERRAAVGLGAWAEYERNMAASQGRTPVARAQADTTATR